MTSESIPLGQLIRDETRISYGIVQPGKHIEEGTVFVQAKDIAANNQDTAQLSRVEPKIALGFPRTKLSGGELLVSIVGVVGASMVAPLEFAGANVSRSVAVIKTGDKETSEWIHYVIQSHEAQCFIDAYCDRAVQPRINLQTLAKLPIYFPHKAKRIDISNHLRTIDDFLKISSQITQKSNQMISALFRSWFIDFDPVKAKAEGKLPYGMDEETAALFPDSFEDSELGPIPVGWTIGTIHNIAKQRKDIARPEVFNEMLPYIGLEHMPRNSIALTEWGVSEDLESNKFRYSTKDILFGKLRPYFHKVGPAPLEGVCSTDILVIQPIDEKLGGFLLPILSSEHFVNFVSRISEGVGLPRTKWEHFKLYKIALPPIEIREKFVSLVDPMLQIIESSIHESKGLEHARDALLPRLMSGELTIPEVI